MRWSILRRVIVLGAILAWPVTGYAQEAAVSGTVKDTTGGVLPGVTVTAVHETTGNTFQAVTGEGGTYRIAVRPGVYRVTAQLEGFTTVVRTGIELLVGQERVVNPAMAVSGLAETVTVTGEAPLLETTSSTIGGNIDPRQMTELPVQGRDWMALASLAPGHRQNQIGGQPVQESREDNPEFNLNVDGQQVSNAQGVGNQPRYSRDAIAEFEFIANRFDATQGRSPAVQVNAITKSGANIFSGLFSSYFRDSDWSAADPVLGRVVPFENQQISTAVGGPIQRDRLHFFGNFEYQRTPLTTIANTAWPSFNISLSGTEAVKMGGGRVDYQLSPKTRLMVRGDHANRFVPFSTLGGNHPAGSASSDETSWSLFGTLTTVLSNRAVNELKAGHSSTDLSQQTLAHWSNHPQASNGITNGNPLIRFRGFQVPTNSNFPRTWGQDVFTVRDDFTFSYDARGRHDLKVGGEFLSTRGLSTNCTRCMGIIDARGGPVPANLEAIFPDPFNVDTWNLAALSSITTRYEIGVGTFKFPVDIPKFGAWVQDDWQISNRLTLNLGVRYDLLWNAFGQQFAFEPWEAAGRPQDADNIQPRVGFAFSLNDRTVVRGGTGFYHADVFAAALFWAQLPTQVALIGVDNDGRPDFAANPFNGPQPTFEAANQRFCYVKNVPGCLIRDLDEMSPPAEYAEVARKWQTSVGVQRQLSTDTAISADYVYAHGTDENILQPNVNLTYNAATGANYPFSDQSRRFNPLWGNVGMDPKLGWSNYHALQTALTKRFSHRWQATVTYLLAGFWTGDPLPVSGLKQVTLDVPLDLGGDYSLAPTDQRHRLVFNGIWQVSHGFQVSGLYFYGSGERMNRIYGADFRGVGTGFEAFGERLRPDGTVVPRADFVGDPIRRVDIRLQQRVPIAGRVAIDGMLEVFNVFDRANFGSYDTDEASPRYGKPNANTNLAYAPRTLQLGFRLTF